MQAHEQPALLSAIAIAFLVALGVKAAIFPLFFWVPAAYPAAPVAVAAVFAGLVTKIGIYALLRVFTLIFTHDVGYTHPVMLVIAALTMASRSTASARSASWCSGWRCSRRWRWRAPSSSWPTTAWSRPTCSFSAALPPGSAAPSSSRGSGGLYRARPLLAYTFLVSGLSLAGLPPFTGFWAKLLLIQATIDQGLALTAAVALGTGLITLLSMSKIWLTVFWGPLPDTGRLRVLPGGQLALLMIPVAALAALTLAAGLWFEPLFVLTARAADGLLDPTAYVHAVLGGTP